MLLEESRVKIVRGYLKSPEGEFFAVHYGTDPTTGFSNVNQKVVMFAGPMPESDARQDTLDSHTWKRLPVFLDRFNNHREEFTIYPQPDLSEEK